MFLAHFDQHQSRDFGNRAALVLGGGARIFDLAMDGLDSLQLTLEQIGLSSDSIRHCAYERDLRRDYTSVDGQVCKRPRVESGDL